MDLDNGIVGELEAALIERPLDLTQDTVALLDIKTNEIAQRFCPDRAEPNPQATAALIESARQSLEACRIKLDPFQIITGIISMVSMALSISCAAQLDSSIAITMLLFCLLALGITFYLYTSRRRLGKLQDAVYAYLYFRKEYPAPSDPQYNTTVGKLSESSQGDSAVSN